MEEKDINIENEHYKFRVRKTILEMLKDRGYDTKNQENEETFDDFMKIIQSGTTINMICYKPSSDAPIEIPLSDRTKIDGTTWATLKPKAMTETYEQEAWYAPLSFDDKKLLEDLRKAQQTQGDLQALIVQNPEGNEQRDPIFV